MDEWDDLSLTRALHYCKFRANSNIDRELYCIFGKTMKRRFQRYLVRTEILSTFHVWIECISVRKIRHYAHSNQWWRKCRKIPETAPSLGEREPDPVQYAHPSTDPTHHAKRQLDWFTHYHTTMQQSPLRLQWDAQLHLQNCLFPFDDHYLYLIHLSLDRPYSPFQTASGSNQPFCHSTLSRQTDRPTDTHAHRQMV